MMPGVSVMCSWDCTGLSGRLSAIVVRICFYRSLMSFDNSLMLDETFFLVESGIFMVKRRSGDCCGGWEERGEERRNFLLLKGEMGWGRIVAVWPYGGSLFCTVLQGSSCTEIVVNDRAFSKMMMMMMACRGRDSSGSHVGKFTAQWCHPFWVRRFSGVLKDWY